MSLFQKAGAYEKREPAPSTPTNPTMKSLLNARDRSDWVKVTIPKTTRAFDVNYDPIAINWRTFEPGKTYDVPPIIADEIKAAIENFEESILLLVQKRNKAGVPDFETIGQLG